MTDDELKALVASLAIDSKELREAQKKTEELMKLNYEQMKLTDEQMKRTDEKLKSMGIHLGNIANNQGDVAEEFFFNSLIKDNHLGAIQFDDIMMNIQKHRGQIQEE